jgi:hypothetical protein
MVQDNSQDLENDGKKTGQAPETTQHRLHKAAAS